MQLLLAGEGWYIEVSELMIEVILSCIFGIANFFMWNHLSKAKFKKIAEELEDEDFEIANYASSTDQHHHYRGIVFLKKDSLNFRGNYYNTKKTIRIDLQQLTNVTVKKVFWINKGFKAIEQNGSTWHFLTEDPDIWEAAIKEKISTKSSAVH